MSKIFLIIAVLVLTGCRRAMYCIDSDGKHVPVGSIMSKNETMFVCWKPAEEWKPLEMK